MLRRCRSHYCGFTNIDFRTKQDDHSISIYMPWKHPKQFGTMGRTDYKLPPDHKEKIFQHSKNIDTLKQITSQCPDPKYHSMCMFYNKHHIPIRKKMNLTPDRVAQLDESVKGKELFIGDSYRNGVVTQRRRSACERKFSGKGETRRIKELKERIVKRKGIENKGAEHETQLVCVGVKEMNEGKVDIEKIKEIRLLLRRKYSHKTDIKKVFREWNLTINGEITINDAFKMINSFGVPINFNETRLLIASANARGTETLNLKEFTSLISEDNSLLNQYNDNKYIEQQEEINHFEKKLQTNVISNNKHKHIKQLENYLRLKIPKLRTAIHDIQKDKTNLISYDVFVKALNIFTIPSHYYNDGSIKGLYDKYVNVNNDNNSNNNEKLLNFDIFSEKLLLDYNKDIPHFNSTERDFILNTLHKKISHSKSQIYENRNALDNNIKQQYNLKQEYLNAITKRENNLSYTNNNEINSMQPSTEFLIKMYGDRKQINETLDKIEKSFFVPRISIYSIKPKTRSGANPIPINTFLEHQPDSQSAMYISETDRFKVKSLNDKVDIVSKDKECLSSKQQCKLNRIRKVTEMRKRDIETKELKLKQKELITQTAKAERLYHYEYLHKLKNEFIE